MFERVPVVIKLRPFGIDGDLKIKIFRNSREIRTYEITRFCDFYLDVDQTESGKKQVSFSFSLPLVPEDWIESNSLNALLKFCIYGITHIGRRVKTYHQRNINRIFLRM